MSARRETLVASVGSVVAAAVMKAPALRDPGHRVPSDLVDPLYQTWQLAWGAHAATATPLSPWAANVFWPLPHSYAFGDSLYGYSPVGVLFGSGPTASLVRYSVVFVLAYALAAAGAYLLARQLGCRPLAASVAAAAYAFAPWHLSQDGHLNVLSNGGIPLCLALLARGHGVGGRGASGPVRPACILAGWAVAAWQLTLGFAVGLQFVYLLGALGLGALALVVTGRWRPAPGRGRAVLAANLAGLALFATIGLALATTYYGVAEAHPQAERTVADLKFFSPPLSGFLVPPATSTLWEGTYRTARSRLVWPTEQALGVGAVLVVLAGYGLLRGDWSRRRRVGLAVAAAGLLLLGAGTTVAGGRLFLLLFDYAPGWRSVRTPGRLVILVTLALALLAANGADQFRRGARWPRVIGLALVGLVLLDGHGSLATPRVPAPSPGLAAAADPVLVLPSDDRADMQAMWASTDGFPRIVNGVTGFILAPLAEARRRTVGFPDPTSVAYLRQLGVRSVVLRPAQAGGTPWAGAEARSVSGLGVTVRPVGGDLVYDLAPPPPP